MRKIVAFEGSYVVYVVRREVPFLPGTRDGGSPLPGRSLLARLSMKCPAGRDNGERYAIPASETD